LLIHNDRKTTTQICTQLDVILGQNYFTFQEQIYKPDKEVAMGPPISGIVAEIFLQQLENSHIKFLLDSKHIKFYARYLDDTFLIYDASRTNPDAIVQYANSTHNSLQLTPTLESNNQISFLDLLIIRKYSQIEIDIFHKPTRPTPPSATYPITQLNTSLQHTDRTSKGWLASPEQQLTTQRMANHSQYSQS